MGRKVKRSVNRPKQGRGKHLPSVERMLRITELGRRGDGIGVVENGDDDELCYFTPCTLPGELVRVRTSGKTAELLEVLEPSTDRISPLCSLFGICGGCAAQHINDAVYRTWKRGIVETALRYRGLTVDVEDVIDAHGSGRRRVTFHARFIRGKPIVGFMRPRSNDLIELSACPILAQSLEAAPAAAKALASPFSKTSQQIDIAITGTPDGLDCDIRGGRGNGYDTHVSLAEIADQHDLARVSIDGTVALERRKPTLSIGAYRVTVPPACFLQATDSGEETLANLVLSEIKGEKKVADLFCGIGPFTLRIAPNAAVYAADSNAAAIRALDETVRHGQGLKPVETETRDLFRNPVFHGDLKQFDAVIFNPARAGAEAQAEEIASSDVPTVICVSCDPASLARDAEILVTGGYHFERAIPVDQFRFSSHIETVAIFRRT